MGAERARVVVELQRALLRAAAEFGGCEAFEEIRPRVLASAAALDYVLMLATGTAGARIPHRDADRAIQEGLAHGVDELIRTATTIVSLGTPAAHGFGRDAARTLHTVLRDGSLASEERSFAVIALANA